MYREQNDVPDREMSKVLGSLIAMNVLLAQLCSIQFGSARAANPILAQTLPRVLGLRYQFMPDALCSVPSISAATGCSELISSSSSRA